MTKNIVLVCFMAMAAVTACNQKDKEEGLSTDLVADNKLTTIDFADTLHDFGKIQEGEIVTYTFSFKNTGKSPLVIDNASASCGCTVPEKPEKPVAPGESGDLTVKFNSQGKSGTVTKEVYVTSNTQPTRHVLTIRAEIENNNTNNQ